MRKHQLSIVWGLILVTAIFGGLLGVLEAISNEAPGAAANADTVSTTPSTTPSDSNHINENLGVIDIKIDSNIDASLPDGNALPHIPLFEVTGATHTSLLRTTSTTIYNSADKAWQFDENHSYYEYNGANINSGVTQFDQETVDNITVNSLVGFENTRMPVPVSLYTVLLSLGNASNYYPTDRMFFTEDGLPQSYSFQAANYDFDQSILINAKLDPTDEFMQLPAAITERTRQLAQNLTESLSSPYEKAKAIETYLKNNYTYSFNCIPSPSGWEPNDWFLFEEKKGVCANFNSAFVVLCRSAGVPARLVGGYMITAEAKTQTVYSNQAHAWAEVKFEDIGWLAFDATGSGPSRLETATTINTVNPSVEKGHSFLVQGSVTTPDGSTVEGVPVEVFLSTNKEQGGTLIGQGTVTNGNFNVDAVIPIDKEVGNYQVLAHCLGDIHYLESWSDPEIKVTAETKINIDIPQNVKTNELISITGSLTEEFGNPLAGQPIVLYFASSKSSVPLITDGNGKFNWQQSFAESGDNTIFINYLGNEYQFPSSNEANFKILTSTAIDVQTRLELNTATPGIKITGPPITEPPTAGTPIIIEGHLKDEYTAVPIIKQPISLYIDSVPVASQIETDAKGYFSLEYSFISSGSYNIEATFEGAPYYWESSKSISLNIIAPTEINMTPPEKPDDGHPVSISGSLREKVILTPVAGQHIEIFSNGEPTGDNLVTDGAGNFTMEKTFERGNYEIEARFAGATFYQAADVKLQFVVLPASSGFPLIYLLTGVIPVIIGAGAYFLYRKQRNNRVITLKPQIINGKMTTNPGLNKSRTGISLTMEFPQIEEPFQDVWGIGDKLEIKYHLLNSAQRDLANSVVTVNFGRKPVQLVTDEYGRASSDYIFREKGNFNLKVSFGEGRDIQEILIERILHIVDYREEIVGLFGELKLWINGRGISLPTDATPREIIRKAASLIHDVSESRMNDAVNCFEEANYSLHQISRDFYKKMFLAKKTITENSGTESEI